ncbi:MULTISPECIES: hypothetical protein [Mycobacteriaceae]|uniref:Uncharacterized protein n=1 Tax=Mycolicibacterium neoaurum VKM Ac-1815D TaxID=700508 RepID=V5XID1_MYCNE|nr:MULTISPECIES: hypothetical protein [Mycobacteriaceae]AHC27777.1 hypothetical protein D174_00320 [Mycolicibacterium neoaurum VKM Ac-1815D]AMO03891.1 hypothetical protein MyAD_00305 [Mycolicibacterium neoaurum]AXK77851.1 hypothetical protein DXK33_24865 [Mycolicibacterium neoaurum]KJQ48272.1 hypothetical protein TS71_22335 [Mycolicibacterium neoaurum]KUM06457.1 hypothetical protein AVZ31_21455 [Mycolicibacterium neoaurum]
MTDTVTPENTESTADTFIDAEIVPVVESDTGPHAGDVLERQLDAGQDLSTHLIEATTDAAVAVVESPAKVIAAIRSGATLPAALGETNEAVQEAVLMAGSRIRTAVGAYVNQQAPLPNAVIVGAAEVAAATVRGQGELVSSAVDGVFEVAVTVGRRGDVRDVIDREWSEFNATAVSVREAVEARIAVARRSIRDAVS